MLGENLV
jgi:hypothetical protein